jgi:hypothetical protein
MTSKDTLGATGNFPKGKLTPSDEGEIKFAMGTTKDHQVIIDFGTPCKWLALEPEGAMQLASLLVKHAREAARGTDKVLTFTV